jgi:molybdate transport system ATP-binding protein
MIKIDITKQLHGSAGEMELSVDIEIKSGDFIALNGKSGSGKTTFLRILAGLEESNGLVEVDGIVFQDRSGNSLAIQKREIGFVFQDYALFENMSIQENLLFVNKDNMLAEHLLKTTELYELRKRFPHSLSGGQKQRVALCRALMNKPKLLLMDEPFSALDPAMRLKLQNELLLLHKEFGFTTIMVSHDPSEIYRLADRVIVLEQGVIIKDGSPKDILLKTTGSQKFSFEGEVLDIVKVDVIYIVIVSIAQQIVEVVVTSNEAKNISVGSTIRVGTKAFSPTISI